MAGFTSAIVALGGLGMSAADAFKANKEKQEAERAASVARTQFEGIQQDNKMKYLKAPDISRLAFERSAQQTADNLRTLQQMGPEGAAQAARIEQQSRASNLQAAENQAKANYMRDAAVAQTEQEIENSRVQRQEDVLWAQLGGAQMAAAEARQNQASAISGAMSSLGDVVTGIGQGTSLEETAQRRQRRASRQTEENPFSTNINDPYGAFDVMDGWQDVNQWM